MSFDIKESAKIFNLQLTDEDVSQLRRFEQLLKEYNSHTNLISHNDLENVMTKHIFDSLAFGFMLNSEDKLNVIDIGSGGGFPAILLAIVMKNSKITAVDSTRKKTDFLMEAALKLELKNFTVLNTRIEDVAHNGDYRGKFDIVTARALSALSMLSEYSLPLLKPSGKLLAYKALSAEQELQTAQNALKILGGKLYKIFPYEIELEEKYQRNLVVIEKEKSTEEIYPRKFGVMKNKPL